MESKELIEPPGSVPATTTNNWTNAEGGIQAQTIQNLILNFNESDVKALLQMMCQMFGGIPTPAPHAIEWASMDHEHFCLFVLENEDYACGSFSIPYECSLKEKCTEEALIDKYMYLRDKEITSLKKMPCIFAKRNMGYKKTDSSHPFFVGRIDEIYKQRSNIKIRFTVYNPPIPQSALNENPQKFGLLESALTNELDMEHWAIKNLDLIKVIEDLGFRIN